MHRKTSPTWLPIGAVMLMAIAAFVSLPVTAVAADIKLTLAGAQEVPANNSSGTGTGTISVDADMTVHGSVTTSGIAGTMAHIHEAAPGANGPVVIALEKKGDTYSVPANTKLTEAQFASFKAGNLYVNVHSPDHPGGEIRAQLKP